jgi:ribosomal protein S18 acetylase RimI-like enzyme
MSFGRLDSVHHRAAVAALFEQANDYALLETGLPSDAATVEDFFTAAPPGIDATDNLNLGLWQQDRLIGLSTTSFGWPESRDAYLGLMILAPLARNQGQGSALLAEIASQARARGATRLLLAVLEENASGLRFWQREGFQIVLSAPPTMIGRKTHIRHRMARAL